MPHTRRPTGEIVGAGFADVGVKSTLPILLADFSVNHTLWSGPVAMPEGVLKRLAKANSAMTPEVVICPTFPEEDSVNQRLPSGHS